METVTLLHGFTLSGASWDDLRSRLPAGWNFITPDLRGHGTARVAPCTMDDCAADLVAMWDDLGIDGSHVVGYSMGGRLALHVAVRLPERTRSLLTIGAHAGLEGDARHTRRAADEALAAQIEHDGIERFVEYWEALPMFAGIPQDISRRLHEIRLQNSAAGLAASLRGMGAGAMEPLWSELPTIARPSTFVAGARDTAFVEHARHLGAAVPGSRVVIAAETGHSVQFEQPDMAASTVEAHLRWAASATSSSTTA